MPRDLWPVDRSVVLPFLVAMGQGGGRRAGLAAAAVAVWMTWVTRG